jgi:glutathione S-transferase
VFKLYEYPPSGNCYKVRLLLNQLDIPFERITVDTQSGATRTPEFLELNPNGRVPVLILPDGSALAESNAILWYLAEDTPFVPDSKVDRARALEWMFFEQYSHEPYIATVRNWIAYANKREEFADRIREFRPKAYAALGVMERRLAGRDWFAGNRYSIADIALYAYTHVAGEGEFDLGDYSAIRAWLVRVAEQPRHVPITA